MASFLIVAISAIASCILRTNAFSPSSHTMLTQRFIISSTARFQAKSSDIQEKLKAQMEKLQERDRRSFAVSSDVSAPIDVTRLPHPNNAPW
jgi:hypothetical protein